MQPLHGCLIGTCEGVFVWIGFSVDKLYRFKITFCYGLTRSIIDNALWKSAINL